MSPLYLLNFLVLQWFGVRLARVVEWRPVALFDVGTRNGDYAYSRSEMRRITVGWTWLRWVWPLTGWWSDYRWIARRR